MKLVVGLGNPEDKYAGTRHNLGFEVVDRLVLSIKYQGSWETRTQFKSQICNLQTTPYNLILCKPQTYMNMSGMAVAKIARFFKIKLEDIVIIHDDLDLPLGQVKIRLGGSAAGHHGVESVISHLGSDKFIRIRLGIGNLKTQLGERKASSFNAEKYVLERFLPGERHGVKAMIKKTVEAVKALIDTTEP